MSARISLRPILLFLLFSFAGAWLVASPLWISGQGLAMPGTLILMVVMMFTPALAALLTHRIVRTGERFTDVTTLKPTRPVRSWIGYAILAWLSPIVMVAAALLISALFGWYHFDLVEFSGAEAAITAIAGDVALPMPIGVLVGAQMVSLLAAPVINVIPAMGEELGWRGFLQARLLPLGQWRAAILTGIAWGLWHAPVILLGYNYPGQSPLFALALMVVFCVLMSVLLCWITVASGTVWTAGIAHGFINGVAGMGMLLGSAEPTNSALVGMLGVAGWIVMALLITVLVVARAFPVRSSRRTETASVALSMPS